MKHLELTIYLTEGTQVTITEDAESILTERTAQGGVLFKLLGATLVPLPVRRVFAPHNLPHSYVISEVPA